MYLSLNAIYYWLLKVEFWVMFLYLKADIIKNVVKMKLYIQYSPCK